MKELTNEQVEQIAEALGEDHPSVQALREAQSQGARMERLVELAKRAAAPNMKVRVDDGAVRIEGGGGYISLRLNPDGKVWAYAGPSRGDHIDIEDAEALEEYAYKLVSRTLGFLQ